MSESNLEFGPKNEQSKAEIDSIIETLNTRKIELEEKKNLLQTELQNLLHSYSKAGKSLDEFKEAKQALEERIESPYLSDRFVKKFKDIFNWDLEAQAKGGKAEFLTYRAGTDVSIDYRDSGTGLREAVSEISHSKNVLREEMGEDLSFRGGKIEGEEKAPREESVEKITQAIEAFDKDIVQVSDDIATKKEEALEAWKKENPEEWAKIEKQDERKKLFQEFLLTNPDVSEIAEIGIRNKDNELFAEVRDILKEKGENLVTLRLYTPEDYEYMSQLIDRAFSSESKAKELIRSSLYLLPHELQIKVVDKIAHRPRHAGCGLYCESTYRGQVAEGSTCISAEYYSYLPSDLREKLRSMGPKELYEDLEYPSNNPQQGIEYAYNEFFTYRPRIGEMVRKDLELFRNDSQFSKNVLKKHLVVALRYKSPLARDYAEQVANNILEGMVTEIESYQNVDELKKAFSQKIRDRNEYHEYYEANQMLIESDAVKKATSQVEDRLAKRAALKRNLS